jgi:hypothetical protein
MWNNIDVAAWNIYLAFILMVTTNESLALDILGIETDHKNV